MIEVEMVALLIAIYPEGVSALSARRAPDAGPGDQPSGAA